jgi:hypothetical protein
MAGIFFHTNERLYTLDLLMSWRTHLAKGLSPTSAIEASFASIEIIRLLKRSSSTDRKVMRLD